MKKIILFHKRKGDTNVCTVLDKIKGKTADQLLQEYQVQDTLPIDLKKLMLSIGISALPFNFDNIESQLNKGEIQGILLTDGGNAAIFYRETDSSNRQRFTLAHELAHACLLSDNEKFPHIEYRIEDSDKDSKERACDIFAGELLIPLNKLKEVYMSLELPISTILASRFGVSTSVMEARLNYLKISHYNSKGVAVAY